jgi:CBS domain-containing protein
VKNGTLVGIVTVADIVGAIAELDIQTEIKNYFERKVTVVWSEMPLPVVGAVMEFADVHACPVLDSDLKLVGIVSEEDLIAASIIEDTLERASAGTPTDEDEWTWESNRDMMARYYEVSRIKLRDIKVREAMVTPITAIKSSKVSECAGIMKREKIDQIPVVNAHQKLIGMLMDRDLLLGLINRQT